MNETPLIFCAVDAADMPEAETLVAKAAPLTGAVKLGLTFWNRNGPEGVAAIMGGHPDTALFLDLKLHDIPMQVAGAVRAVVPLAPAFLTLHASGGFEMMQAAAQAAAEEADKLNLPRPSLLGITVLTSLDEAALADVGQQGPAAEQVLRLAKLAQKAGFDGVVCSAHEVAVLRRELGPDFTLMVPGIRPAGSEAGDQKRVMTPGQAVRLGASHLVIGRPITEAADPEAVIAAIMDDIKSQKAA